MDAVLTFKPGVTEMLDQDPDIDLSSAFAYMARNGLQRMSFTIEAVDLDRAADSLGTAVIEELVLTDDSTPSDLGLEGVFFVVDCEAE